METKLVSKATGAEYKFINFRKNSWLGKLFIEVETPHGPGLAHPDELLVVLKDEK